MSIQLPALPGSWSTTRVDRVASVNARIGWKALTADEYQPDGYAFLSTPNIKNEEIDFENVNFITEDRYEESPELKLQTGDVLLAKDGNTLGIANIVKDLPRPATVNGSIAVIRPFGIDPTFLKYLFQSQCIQATIGMLKGGMGVPHLFQWDIKRLPVPLPPPIEQQRIADFLDAETARIDALASAKLRQSACLVERWTVKLANEIDLLLSEYGAAPLRRFTVRVEQGWSPQCEDAVADAQEWAVLKTSAVSSGHFLPLEHKRLPDNVSPDRRYEIRDGNLLLTRGSGSPEHVGMPAIAHTDGRKLLLSDLLYRVVTNRGLDTQYLAFSLQSKPIRASVATLFRGQSGQTIKLRGEDIKSIPIPAAPLDRQNRTTQMLMEIQASHNAVSQKIEKTAMLLQERRAALITAAVTGQFDVSTASGRGVTE